MSCNRVFSGEFGRRGLEELDGILYQLDHNQLIKVRNLIDDYTKEKVKKVSKIQLMDIPAYCLRAGDIIFDLQKKTLSKVQYVSHYDARWDDNKPNTIMISYGEDYDCDNVEIHSTVTIAIDLEKYVDLKCTNLELSEIDTMYSRRNELYTFISDIISDENQKKLVKNQLDIYFGKYPIGEK